MRAHLIILLALALQLSATTVVPAQQTDARLLYDSVRTRLQSGDTAIDYSAFRMAYVETDLYSLLNSTRDDERAMDEALNAGDWELAVEHGLKMLDKNYTSLDAHFGLSIAYEELKQYDQAILHKTIQLGLLRAIIGTGDGRTAETAWQVISVDEEYFILAMLDLKRTGQSLEASSDGQPVDKMNVIDRETGEEETYFFNVSIVFDRLYKTLQER